MLLLFLKAKVVAIVTGGRDTEWASGTLSPSTCPTSTSSPTQQLPTWFTAEPPDD